MLGGVDPGPGVRRGPRTLRRRLLLGLAPTLGLLLAGEVAARVGYRGRWPHPVVHDPELGWVHRPGWRGEVRAGVEARFDGLGLRGGEVGPKLPSGAGKRVLLLGDSIAFGYGLQEDETIASALARRAGVEVLNAGVEGYGTEQATILLRRLAPVVRPDVVVLVVCARNDLGVPALDGTQGHDLAPRSPAVAALVDRSALAFAAARLVHRRAVQASREQGGPPQFLPPDAVAALAPAERSRLFEQMRARLQAFRDAARAAGAAPVLAVCPDQAILDQAALRAAAFEPLLALGAGLEVPTLDLTPAVRGGLREKDGVHPTPVGAGRIATALRELLAARGLVP